MLPTAQTPLSDLDRWWLELRCMNGHLGFVACHDLAERYARAQPIGLVAPLQRCKTCDAALARIILTDDPAGAAKGFPGKPARRIELTAT